ncbi:MAG TPA: hypothetical protein VET83_03810 [Candidatus Dormibacteraeota bacterium]|jgi:hypothetical protein|nr:hypothetical protein [Candidatus Dormibacteraeota bacterium]
MLERGCKVRCSACGYFEDCSDPGAPGEWVEADIDIASRPVPSDDES